MKLNWPIIGTVAALAFQTVALVGTITTSASATQSEIAMVKTRVEYLTRDVQRLTDKVFP